MYVVPLASMAAYITGQDPYIKATNILKSQKVNLAVYMKSMLPIKAWERQLNLRGNNGNSVSHRTVLVFGVSTETTDYANSLQYSSDVSYYLYLK